MWGEFYGEVFGEVVGRALAYQQMGCRYGWRPRRRVCKCWARHLLPAMSRSASRHY